MNILKGARPTGNDWTEIPGSTRGGLRRMIDGEPEYWYPETVEKGGEGEGSRGGHVIGHTRSGKPIYEKSHTGQHASAHDDWSVHDHADALAMHADEYRRHADFAARADIAQSALGTFAAHASPEYAAADKALRAANNIHRDKANSHQMSSQFHAFKIHNPGK